MKHNNKQPADNRVLLYEPRTMTECMNAAIDFMRGNWKKLLRYSLYILLPVCIIQTIGIVSVIDSAFSEVMYDQIPWVGLLSVFIFGAIGFLLLNTFLWSTMKVYLSRPDGISSATFRDIRRGFAPMLWRMTKGTLLMTVVLLPLLVVPTLITAILPFGYFVYMMVMLPIVMILPVYAFEDISFVRATVLAFKLGYRRFGGLVLLSLTLIILIQVLQGVVMLPWAAGLLLRGLLIKQQVIDIPLVSALSSVLLNLLSILLCYVTYLSAALMMLTAGYLYGSATQQTDDKALMSDIENFENL